MPLGDSRRPRKSFLFIYYDGATDISWERVPNIMNGLYIGFGLPERLMVNYFLILLFGGVEVWVMR